MSEKRAHWSHLICGSAKCNDCDWQVGPVGLFAKGPAAQHHDHTGHVVYVVETVGLTYGEDRARDRRWWKRPTEVAEQPEPSS